MAPKPSHLSLRLFAQTFADNSTLDDSERVPSSPTRSVDLMLNIQILRNDVSQALAGLNPWKAYGPDGDSPTVLMNCSFVLATCLVKHFRLCE